MWAKAYPSLLAAYGNARGRHQSAFRGDAQQRLLLTHVPWADAAINDLIGGHLPMLINSLPDMLEQHRGGRLRIIATTGRERRRSPPKSRP